MKDIGDYLKQARIKNGVSLDEASEDLNMSIDQLENIEEGNVRAFKDVFSLRGLVCDYAKYLGIEINQVLEEFNDFMFEHTSKISLNDIMEARAVEPVEKKVISPYTKKPKESLMPHFKPVIIFLGILLFVLVVIFIVIQVFEKDDSVTSELMGSGRSSIYELTY